MNLITILLVALGGAIGSIARYLLAYGAGRLLGSGFPWGTIVINILGSFIIGWFATLSAADGRAAQPEIIRAFVMAGVCGGFTTFSAFSLQSFELLRGGEPISAIANITGSVALCLVATFFGAWLARG